MTDSERELLGRLAGQQDAIIQRLDRMEDKQDKHFERHNGPRVQDLDNRVDNIERWQATHDTRAEVGREYTEEGRVKARWLWDLRVVVGLTAGMGIVGIADVIVQVIV